MRIMASDRFQYIRHIDSGGQGSVSLYEDTFLDREVAVKTILIQNQSEDTREVDLLKCISSKHVVGLYDVIRAGNCIEIYQEYLGGDSLADKIGKCSNREFLSLAYQLACGLSDIHDSGVCHRDIKLDNVKFDEQGVLKIFDFGVSRTGDPHKTVNGWGTLEYLAPETFKLQTAPSVELSFAVDVFALGATLHKLAFNENCNFTNFVPNTNPTYARFETLGFSKELSSALNLTVASEPRSRPSAIKLRLLLQRELLKDQHVGLFVAPNNIHTIDKSSPTTRIKIKEGLFITVHYNGFDFLISDVGGEVLINNENAEVGKRLYGACVLTFVISSAQRFFVSFSSSHPEIVL